MGNEKISRKDQVDVFLKRLAERLRLYREANGYTQDKLSEILGFANRSTISRWEKGEQQPRLEDLARLSQLYGCSLNELIGNLDHNEKDIRISFTTRIPASIMLKDELRIEIQQGINILKALIEGMTLENLYELDGLEKYRGNRDGLFALVRTALISGEITFTHIPRSKILENKIVQHYPHLKAKDVIVVDLPATMISEAIPPELVAWAGAYAVFRNLNKPTRVGLGNGYTIFRMCANALPSQDQFSGTYWVPLVAYRKGEEATVNSANYLAAFLRHRYHNSVALHLPYSDQGLSVSDLSHEEIRREWERLNTVFIGGYGWSKEDNVRVPTSYRNIYRFIESNGDAERLAGEILGHVLDHDGNILGKQTLELMNAVTTRIPLEDLQRCVKNTGSVYFVGSRAKKAPIVKVALLKGYINGLIIDSDLARALTNTEHATV